jgi:tetratricopeptide (TPR) repeat protein
MSNFDFDNEPEDQINILELVEKYEQATKGASIPFFEQEDYEVLVEYYQAKGQLDYAMDVAEKSLIQYPYSAVLLLKKAQILFDLKQLFPALELLDVAAIYDSSEIGIPLLRAEIYTFQSKYKEAVALLQDLLSTTTEREELSDIYLQLCDVYEDWEKYHEVYDCLIACLQIDTQNEEALSRFNYCVEITEKFADSIPFHQHLIDIDPYNEFAWYNLACAYRGMKEYEKSINAFEYVLAINDDADYVYQDMADLHYKNGAFQKALDVLKDMTETFEPDDEIYFLQGKCHEALGNMKMARYCFKKAVRDNPSLSDAYFRIGETYKQEGLWEQAYKSFQKANELEKEQYEFCLAMAEAALEIGENDVALDACESAIDIFVKRYEAYFILAKVMALNGDTNSARQVLLTGAEVCKTSIELNYGICAVAFMEDKLKEGEVLLRLLLEEDYNKHVILFDFNEDLKEQQLIQRILAEYH